MGRFAPNIIDLVWLAALLEGEGSFYLRTRGDGRWAYPTISLAMTDKDVVVRARDIMDHGRVRDRKVTGLGTKPQYVWQAEGAFAGQVMQAVLPYMGQRRSAKITEILEGAS